MCDVPMHHDQGRCGLHHEGLGSVESTIHDIDTAKKIEEYEEDTTAIAENDNMIMRPENKATTLRKVRREHI